jgi:DNA polymerase-3 subunit epsilon
MNTNQTGFAALDFETADRSRDSACSVAVVRVEGGRVVDSLHTLLRPPRREFVFSYLHGITWEMVRSAPTFADAWPNFRQTIQGVGFIAAHNARFDEEVLRTCGRGAGIIIPDVPFLDTLRLAREVFGICPTDLANVCRVLQIPLVRHHDAMCDALACAQIVLAAHNHRRRRA